MKLAPAQIRTNCPACGTPITAEVWQVIDVGQEPDLKRRLLRGQLNVVDCPSCSSRVAVATPLAYHDPDGGLFLILIPSQMGLAAEEQDKAIGELTNLVMSSLPPEQRRGYLFQPKTFFSMDSLLSEILRAEGISDEMMEEQRHAAQLMQDLLAQLDDQAAFAKLVAEKKGSLDYGFLLFLSASIDQATEDGDEQTVQELTRLRDRLNAQLAPAAMPQASESPEGTLTREELLERLFEHRDAEMLESLVAVSRPFLDYQFFLTMTRQIETAQSQGDAERAEQLTALRTRILDLVDQLDKEAQEALNKASSLLEQILSSDDLDSAVKDHAEEIDATFLAVLEARAIAEQQSPSAERVEKLASLKEQVVSLLESHLPPEMRLLNQLVAEEDLAKRRVLLQQQPDAVTQDFLKLLNLIVEDLRAQSQETAAERLAEIIPDVEAMLQEGEDIPPGAQDS
jgi:hypothetical protein